MEKFGHDVSIRLDHWRKFLFIFPYRRTLWLTIYEYEDYWHAMVHNLESGHQPLNGTTYGVDYLKSDGSLRDGPRYLTGAWKAALSMWPVSDEQEVQEVFDYVSRKIDKAYNDYILKDDETNN